MPPSVLSHTSHAHERPFQSPAYLTAMTLPSWSTTLLTTTLSKTTTTLDWGQSKFQPPERCKVSCAATSAQHSRKGELVTPTQSPREPHLLMSTCQVPFASESHATFHFPLFQFTPFSLPFKSPFDLSPHAASPASGPIPKPSKLVDVVSTSTRPPFR